MAQFYIPNSILTTIHGFKRNNYVDGLSQATNAFDPTLSPSNVYGEFIGAQIRHATQRTIHSGTDLLCRLLA